MAKSKHSAALFEVINSSKRSESAAQSMRTPKWWFKGRQTPSHAPLPEPSFTAPAPAAPTPAPAPRPSAPLSNVSRFEGGRSSAVHFAFDGDRKEVTVRLRYTTAVVSAFGVFVLVGLAYVLGRHLNRGPQMASAADQPNIQQLMRQPAQSGVADVNRQRPSYPSPANTPPARRHASEATNVAKPHETTTLSLVPATAEVRLPRTIGLNYTIIQTYPPEEIQSAQAARDFLTRNGIPCTLERTDYVRNPDWVCLVGTAGFTHISSPEYKAYVDNIVRLGEKFPSSHFDRFRPAAYKWKG